MEKFLKLLKSKVLIVFILSIFLYAEDVSIQLSEKNLLLTTKIKESSKYKIIDFNRLRAEINSGYENIRFKLIIDNENFVKDESYAFDDMKTFKPNLPFNPHLELIDEKNIYNRLYLYRATIEVEFEKSDITIGLQRVPFGVGKMWTPSDIFNPVNALSIEKGERAGVFGANYNYHSGDLSSIQAIVALDRDKKIDKRALRYKTFAYGADLGISLAQSRDFFMVSFESEANLGESGAEVHFEGIYFDYENKKDFFSFVAGGEYGFENTTYVLSLEYFYNGNYKNRETISEDIDVTSWIPTGKSYIGSSLSFEIMPLLTSSLSCIFNLEDGGLFYSGLFQYSLKDDMTLSTGFNFTHSDKNDEFHLYTKSAYISLEYYF